MLDSLRICTDRNHANDSGAGHADKYNEVAHSPNKSRTNPFAHWLNKKGANAKNNLLTGRFITIT